MLELETVKYELQGRLFIVESGIMHGDLIGLDQVTMSRYLGEAKGLRTAIETIEEQIKKASEKSEA